MYFSAVGAQPPCVSNTCLLRVFIMAPAIITRRACVLLSRHGGGNRSACRHCWRGPCGLVCGSRPLQGAPLLSPLNRLQSLWSRNLLPLALLAYIARTAAQYTRRCCRILCTKESNPHWIQMKAHECSAYFIVCTLQSGVWSFAWVH